MDAEALARLADFLSPLRVLAFLVELFLLKFVPVEEEHVNFC